MSVRSISAGNFGRRLSSNPVSGQYAPPGPNGSSNNAVKTREQSTGANTLPNGGFSPKGERAKAFPNSMGESSPLMGRRIPTKKLIT